LKTAGPVSFGNSGLKMIRFMTHQEKMMLICQKHSSKWLSKIPPESYVIRLQAQPKKIDFHRAVNVTSVCNYIIL
jgi:hypothetical protein